MCFRAIGAVSLDSKVNHNKAIIDRSYACASGGRSHGVAARVSTDLAGDQRQGSQTPDKAQNEIKKGLASALVRTCGPVRLRRRSEPNLTSQGNRLGRIREHVIMYVRLGVVA